MNKLILTCFLALLCLVGRYLTASSKVADSPPEKSLHRSTLQPVSPHSGDIHRGGAILSDTFRYSVAPLQDNPTVVELDNRAITQAPFSPLRGPGGTNGHPATHRASDIQHPTPLPTPQLSLELSGNEGSKLAPHSRGLRSVSLSNPSTVDRGPNLPSSSIGHPTAVELDYRAITQALFSPLRGAGGTTGHPIALPSQMGPSLVDDSTSQRQEEGNTPARVGEFFTLKGLLKSSPTEKHGLSYKLSTQEIDPYYGRAQLSEDSIALLPGSFYAGTSGRQVFELKIPVSGGFGRLSVYDGGSPWLEDIWVKGGDSLVLHREGTRLFFSGPSADAVRIQIQLQELFAASNAERNPVMILSDAGAMLNTPAKAQAYQDAVDSSVPGWSRHMVWLESEADKLNRAKELFSVAGDGHPVLTALERSREVLDPERYRWLYGYWKGRLASQALRFAAIAKPASADWASLIMEYSPEEDFSAPQQGKAPAELVEALYLENKLLSALTPVSFLHLSESLPDPLEEQVNALFLVREYKEQPYADSLFRQVIDKTQSPEILAALEPIYRSSLKGRDFASFAFEDETGGRVLPEEWKGKLVLMDFWLSGCGACLKFASESFLPMLEEFQDHSGLVFVTVSGDRSRELWKQSLASGKYTNGQAVNLFSGGASHPTLRENLIQSFPAQLILDREGKILQTGSFPEHRQGWIELIKSHLGESSPVGASTNANAFSHSSPNLY